MKKLFGLFVVVCGLLSSVGCATHQIEGANWDGGVAVAGDIDMFVNVTKVGSMYFPTTPNLLTVVNDSPFQISATVQSSTSGRVNPGNMLRVHYNPVIGSSYGEEVTVTVRAYDGANQYMGSCSRRFYFSSGSYGRSDEWKITPDSFRGRW